MKKWLQLTQGKNTTCHSVAVNADGSAPNTRASRCGRAPLWFDPKGWQPAPETMRKCMSCRRLEVLDERKEGE